MASGSLVSRAVGLVRAALLTDAGIAYMPLELVQGDLAAGRLVRLLPDWQTMTLPIQLVHPSRRVTRRVAVLMETLAAELRQSHPN